MKRTAFSTRRTFFWKAGAALSAPLAATGAAASTGAARGVALGKRLGELEDAEAIRELNRAYARHVNAGAHEALAALFANPAEAPLDASIRRLTAEDLGEHDVIEVAEDGTAATARIRCRVEGETPIEPSCTLVEMARLQGGGFRRWSERRVLELRYVKRGGIWKIERSSHHAV